MRIKICQKTISCLNVHYFKGVIYHDGSVIDSKEAFYNFININKQSDDNIENLLAKCIGVFAFAIEISGNISIVVDIIRAFPLFVSVNDSEIDIYDNLNEYKDNKKDYQPKYIPIANQQAVSTKIGRNEPCPCGSGKKYKKCCMDK